MDIIDLGDLVGVAHTKSCAFYIVIESRTMVVRNSRFLVCMLSVFIFISCSSQKSGFDYAGHRKKNERHTKEYRGDLTKYKCR